MREKRKPAKSRYSDPEGGVNQWNGPAFGPHLAHSWERGGVYPASGHSGPKMVQMRSFAHATVERKKMKR